MSESCPVDGCTFRQELETVREEYAETRKDYQKTHEGYHNAMTAIAVATSELKRAADNDKEIFDQLRTVNQTLPTKVTAPDVARMIGYALALLAGGGGAVWALAVFVLK